GCSATEPRPSGFPQDACARRWERTVPAVSPPTPRAARPRSPRQDRLDSRLGSAMASRHGLQWMRALTMVTSAVIVVAVSDFSNRVPVAALLVVGAVTQFVLVRTARDRTRVTAPIVACDVTLAAAIMAVQPELWPPSALWLGSVLTWHAIVLPQRTAVYVSAYAVVAVAAAGVVGDLPYWWLALATQMFVPGAVTP